MGKHNKSWSHGILCIFNDKLSLNYAISLLTDVGRTLVEFTYLVFTVMPFESVRTLYLLSRHLRVYVLCIYYHAFWEFTYLVLTLIPFESLRTFFTYFVYILLSYHLSLRTFFYVLCIYSHTISEFTYLFYVLCINLLSYHLRVYVPFLRNLYKFYSHAIWDFTYLFLRNSYKCYSQCHLRVAVDSSGLALCSCHVCGWLINSLDG